MNSAERKQVLVLDGCIYKIYYKRQYCLLLSVGNDSVSEITNFSL